MSVRQVFETANLLPQNFFFFEENLEKWETFLESEHDAILKLGLNTQKPPIDPVELKKIVYENCSNITRSFKEGQKINEALGICKKQFANCRKAPPGSENITGESLRLKLIKNATDQKPEFIAAKSIHDSLKSAANLLDTEQAACSSADYASSAAFLAARPGNNSPNSPQLLPRKAAELALKRALAAFKKSLPKIELVPVNAPVQPEATCEQCQREDAAQLRKAIELLASPKGGGGWALTFDPPTPAQ